MVPSRRSTATGCTASLATRRPAPGTGRAGTERPPSSCASAGCCTTRTPTAATGRRMSRVARSTVRSSLFRGTNFLGFHVYPPPFSALCNDDANGNVPLGKSCNRYWQCQGGYPRLQRCPAMLVFDRRSLRCVVPPTEDCDIPTTPQPFDGDLEQGKVKGGRGFNKK